MSCRAGWARPGFLAMLLFEKKPAPALNRQAERFAREGVVLSVDAGRLRAVGIQRELMTAAAR
jgi:hypothetical protein